MNSDTVTRTLDVIRRCSRIAAFVLGALAPAACAVFERTQAIVPSKNIPAPVGDHHRLVIVLPGRGDKIGEMDRSGIAASIQRSLPDADVQFAEFTLAYYIEGRSAQRLHEQFVQPATQRGYREIYLAGASMGGMGVVMYEREHPGGVAGLILMAPYLGEPPLVQEIRAAGGLLRWNPGPVPATLDRDNVPREEWRTVQAWARNPARARSVWLICGQGDGFVGAAALLAEQLPADHYITPAGGHAWAVWVSGATEAFARLARAAP